MKKIDFKNMQPMQKTQLITGGGFLVVLVAIIILAYYDHKRMTKLSGELTTLSDHLATLESSVASTTIELRTSIQNTRENIADDISAQTRNVGLLEQRLQQQVGSVSTTVNTLQKLSKTDPQLLAKYSKVFFLNENYAPARLSEIPESYRFSATKSVSIHADVWPHLQALIDVARRDNINIYVSSGYRSFSEQKALKGDYTVTYGSGTANQFSADQGYSEHQLGTALDFITNGLGGQLDGFDGTPAFPWLNANAYKYGFIISYPKNNKFYVFEPWHWRYVGIKLATYLHDQGKNFYDLDQRKIDEYLVTVFE